MKTLLSIWVDIPQRGVTTLEASRICEEAAQAALDAHATRARVETTTANPGEMR